MKKILFLLAFLFLFPTVYGQSLNGVSVGYKVFPSQSEYREMNESQISFSEYLEKIKSRIEAMFGEGASLDVSLLGDWDVVTAMYPGGDVIDFEGGRLAGYDLETSRFLAVEDIFQGGLRVGEVVPSNLLVPWSHTVSSAPLDNNAPLFNNIVEVPDSDASFKFNVVNSIVNRICMPLRLT